MNSFPCDARRPTIDDVLKRELFFVVGVPKSGTTWLQRILDSSPEIACKGESHFVNILRPALSHGLDSYSAEIRRQAADASRQGRYPQPDLGAAISDNESAYLFVTAMALMFAKWLDDPRIRHIGEKTPNNIKFMPVLATLFPSAKFIHIIRDGRDCAHS